MPKTKEEILKDNGDIYTSGVKSKEEIVKDIIKEAGKTVPQLNNYATGGVFRLFVEVVASFLEKSYKTIDSIHANRFLQTATGKYLEWKAEELGLVRREAQRAKGYVIFTRKTAEGNTSIDKGKVVASPKDNKGNIHRYTVVENALIPEGSLEVAVLVEAEGLGSAYNQLLVDTLVTPISGVESVSTNRDWIEQAGLDEEDDHSLRLRCMALWQGIGGANAAAYKAWAQSVKGVDSVLVVSTPRGAGTVDVVFVLEGNNQPSPQLVGEVQRHIDELKPVATDVLVRSPAEVKLQVSLDVVFLPEYIPDNALLLGAVDSYFKGLGIGMDFEPSALTAHIMAVEGVKSCAVLTPQKVRISDLQIARLKDVPTLTTSVSGEL